MENIQWLLENGGPAIKLNMMNEELIDRNAFNTDELVEELLQIDKVKKALTYFDRFKEYQTIPDNKLNAYIHNCYEDCYEMFMPFFINLGFRAGIPVFDEKVKYMFNVYQSLITPDESGTMRWNHAMSLNVIMSLTEAGYFNEDMLDYLATKFINKIYKTAEQQCFDIYETDPGKIRWSKLPKDWKDKPICKDIHVHDCDVSQYPLPTIYHIKPMVNIYKYIEDVSIKEKIETIIKYTMHPQYQKLRGNYGYGWFYNKSYYACSSGLSLPMYESNDFNMNTLIMMSQLPFAVNTEWFRNCINYIEEYKTERGTYLFPDDWFYHTFVRPANPSVIYDAYISKNAKVKRSEKRSLVIELCSTYNVELLKKRLEN